MVVSAQRVRRRSGKTRIIVTRYKILTARHERVVEAALRWWHAWQKWAGSNDFHGYQKAQYKLRDACRRLHAHQNR